MIWNLDQKSQAVSFLDSVIIWGKGHSQASPLHSFPWEALLKEASLFLPCVFFPSNILLSHCLPCSGFSTDESGMCWSPHLRLRDLCGQEPHPCI